MEMGPFYTWGRGDKSTYVLKSPLQPANKQGPTENQAFVILPAYQNFEFLACGKRLS